MSYSDLIEGDRFFEGQLATAEPALVRSGANAQGAILPFGSGLVRGSGDGLLVLPSAAGQIFLGVAKATNTFEKREGFSLTANGKMGYPVNYKTSFVRRGVVAVPIDSDCTEYGAVYLIHTASTGQVPGHFRKDANSGDADLIPGAVFLTTLAAPGVGLISLNLA